MTIEDAIREVEAWLDYEVQSGRLDPKTIEAIERLISVAEKGENQCSR